MDTEVKNNGKQKVSSSPVLKNIAFPPVGGSLLEGVRSSECLNCATPRSTLRTLVHIKRPLRFLLGHGLSKTACRGSRRKDEDVWR